MSEKIGEDVLGTEPRASKYDKRKQELMEKAKKEVEKKKKAEEEEEEKLSKLTIPGEKPPEMSEEEWQELQMRARLTGQLLEEESKDVHVDEHYRGKPKKKKKSLADTVFDFP